MKKFFIMLEDIWVAVAFAESGIYEPVRTYKLQPRSHHEVRIHNA